MRDYRKDTPMPARYTLVIGTANWSSWSLRPFLALHHIGADFQTVMIPLRVPGKSKPTILKHSPSGKVPLLKISGPASSSAAVGHKKGGKTLKVWDSLAICETLAERHPRAKLWPAAAAARATARATAAEMHSGFPNVRDQLSMMFAERLPLPKLRDNTKAEIARIIASWQTALKMHKGPFLFGRFSIADAMYAPVVSRFVTYGVETPPAVSAYMARIMALPGMIAWGRMAQKEVELGLLNR
jgi:glutathione S-transferase